MPTRVDIADGVISGIGVAVEALRIVGIGDDCVGLDEAAKFGVVLTTESSHSLFEKEQFKNHYTKNLAIKP